MSPGPLPSSSHHQVLDFDILEKVMDILAKGNNRRTIAAMTRTCKYLRAVGIKRLLSYGAVRVNMAGGPQLVAPFCHFMLGDNMVRLPFNSGPRWLIHQSALGLECLLPYPPLVLQPWQRAKVKNTMLTAKPQSMQRRS